MGVSVALGCVAVVRRCGYLVPDARKLSGITQDEAAASLDCGVRWVWG